MSELDTLRPEVQEALDEIDDCMRMDIKVVPVGALGVVRTALLRLAKENADLLSTIELDEQVWIQRDETMHKWIDRARKAEAELAAIKAMIAKAPMVPVLWHEMDGAWAAVPDEMRGQRVALVKVEE